MEILINVIEGDALKTKADVLVLKYAQELFGVDNKVAYRLSKFDENLYEALPTNGSFLLKPTFGSLEAGQVLFVGVEDLFDFRYENIRKFSFNALSFIGKALPETECICFTIHGAGYGLDEIEAFEAEVAGFVDAISNNSFPRNLKQIIIVEIRSEIAKRLREALFELFPKGKIIFDSKGSISAGYDATKKLKTVGYASENKPFVFVAMPFDEKMYDVFHYGIRGAVNKVGYLCERVDEAHFTGDVMERVKQRIKQSTVVIADLTTANPNVYLEIGFAWGCGIPTILLVQDAKDLKFDVKGQKCLIYSSISDLELALGRELENLQ